ncbi:MAG: Tim44/TimA family putative adaptor protein [Hoeflea sp.]|uniref:Tim44/TimA family putative adaptor protein n=1 Tax=Hoeflea sp. TaxID=1940281 RepID=UPI001D74839E|nr:Tim44/TimA family putative adaptor protein [Hoeflea sp.]MBU4531774.1 Tim44/TimA family putative adaptor protein [Alphaproteobacteria bacterium]MBU4544630.1 Tim44/TimA family putative adaptor protein [Alphaproteobacteria bacterium]MBU4552861.1 Tim44/TimA family putative adaptor protein [Alphaproteobacteria bacterium]MBV1725050.1 Tim44/TimA family putative adaptor protein [Hoeflea sp.]MBV1761070.1 Tim44/TimA family putative adaptor protein [Hoeflea sp.]
MGSFDFVTFFFFVAAVIIFVQLRSVLGKRTGHERPPRDQMARRDQAAEGMDDPKVVTLPRRGRDAADTDAFAAVDAYAEPGSELNKGLREVVTADPTFDPKEFVAGATTAYEMIVSAFAEGDRKTLKGLLSREVYDGFVAAIDEREKRGEVVRSNFVGIEKSSIIQAEMKGAEANITLRIVSQLISATLDKDGEVIEGDLVEVTDVNDVWTFARDTRSRDPNWRLIATEADQ